MPVFKYRPSTQDQDMQHKNIDAFVSHDRLKWRTRQIMHTEQVPPPGYYKVGGDNCGLFMALQEVSTEGVAPDPQQRHILAEIQTFWNSRDIYQGMRFPHKRGVLFHGKPGCGKSTLIRLLTKDTIATKGYVFDFCGDCCDGELVLIHFMRSINQMAPEAPIVVLFEDVDRWTTRGHEETVLSFLDGSTVVDHVLFVGTTNKRDDLPERLIRPSRFDRVIEISMPDGEARRLYIAGIVPDKMNTKPFVDYLVEASDGMSMAETKELVLQKVVFKEPTLNIEHRKTRVTNTPITSDEGHT